MGCWYYLIIGFCFVVVVITDNPPSCTTPNGEEATCVSLFSCPILQAAVTSTDPSVKKFIEASSCGNGQFIVCCGTSGNYTQGNGNKGNETATKESHRDFVIRKLLPDNRYCGMQHTDDYFYNETATSVDEFPWMLYIPIISRDRGRDPKTELKCSGILINRRYALTYVACATRFFDSVKLGQYNKNQNVSCIATSVGEDDCTEPALEVEVEKKFSPPDSNFMLLRLAKSISYTDYIRPICLPLEESDRPHIGDTVVTSGWGEEDLTGKDVKIKKRIAHMVTDNEKCPPDKLQTLCATTIQNGTNDVCDGDNGGPLMYKRGNNWFVAGIVSVNFGCINNAPFGAEPITPQILEWIFEKMDS